MRKIGTPTSMFRLTSHRRVALRTENFRCRCFIIRALTATNKTASIFRFIPQVLWSATLTLGLLQDRSLLDEGRQCLIRVV